MRTAVVSDMTLLAEGCVIDNNSFRNVKEKALVTNFPTISEDSNLAVYASYMDKGTMWVLLPNKEAFDEFKRVMRSRDEIRYSFWLGPVPIHPDLTLEEVLKRIAGKNIDAFGDGPRQQRDAVVAKYQKHKI